LKLATTTSEAKYSFIDTELRGAAMRLHTREQAPKEGQAPTVQKREPYKTTVTDYLQFLVDSQCVFQAFEDVVSDKEELAVFRNTGLERVEPLEKDITYLCKEYSLKRPLVAAPGKDYADTIRAMKSVPEFMCHYYNHYFAHTAGGRMIGKQMSALLLNKKTLAFYKVRDT
jgi:heme oxygenase